MALEGGEGSASRPGRSLPPGKTRYLLYMRLGGPQDRSGQVRKISPSTGIRSPDRPARSQSLYRLSYPAHRLGGGVGGSVTLFGRQTPRFLWIVLPVSSGSKCEGYESLTVIARQQATEVAEDVHCSDDEMCMLVSVHGTEACGERSVPNIGTEWWRVVGVAEKTCRYPLLSVGRDSSVGIATELWAGRSGVRIPVAGFPGCKPTRSFVDRPNSSSPEVKERVELHLFSPLYVHGRLKGELYLALTSSLVWGSNPVGGKRFSAHV